MRQLVRKATRLWHTVRHVKPIQIYGRLWFRLYRPKPDVRPPPPTRSRTGNWTAVAEREPSLESATRLRFLSESHDIADIGWDAPRLEKLWRYNLHYFDDLNAEHASVRTQWHRSLIRRWILECPPVQGVGWEPYPTSLRLVNWIKWVWAGNEPAAGMVDSMAVQLRHLSKRLEWHLLGNHLFVNAKALVMGGHFFCGPEADAWREKGWQILRDQIPEQILSDGGQFERSPMYHALALEDMLDLINTVRLFPTAASPRDEKLVEERISGMRAHLTAMCHPDGQIAFFNDSAIGVSPHPQALESYASRLGFGPTASPPKGTSHQKASGFVRMQTESATLIADVGDVGPSYLPGHAHAGTLSFELSVRGRRLLVNSGTSLYGTCPERLRQRGTPAHNTVAICGQNSSDVWSGFRVGKRAHVTSVELNNESGPETLHATLALVLKASHDGFRRLRLGGDHCRQWHLHPSQLEVVDQVTGSTQTESFWHFAPEWELRTTDSPNEVLADGHGMTVVIRVRGGSPRLARSTYHPRFGATIKNWAIDVRFTAPSVCISISW